MSDEDDNVCWLDDEQYNGAWIEQNEHVVRIENRFVPLNVHLDYKQALRLLAWLEQNKATLEQA